MRQYCVLLSENAYKQVTKAAFVAKNEYEIGGVLLGYMFYHLYYVIEATVAVNIREASSVSFFLDSEEHEKLAQSITERYRIRPTVLGVWHSHTYDMDRFSYQDRASNQKMAEVLDGALSMLITMPCSAPPKLATYYITKNGAESLCKTIFLKHKPG